ncbi:MAG: TIGR00730 family Rossman fold protein [Bacteroidota bacterium]
MKRLCVYCGSRPGKSPIHQEKTRDLGTRMAQEGIDLVYGGGNVGLMGLIADTIMAQGGQVTGVIPKFLANNEIAHEGITELIMVTSMHERKQKMSELADGFITLSGGIGTFEEFFEMLSWFHLQLHHKPIGILNVEGYYDSLLQFLNQVERDGFLSKATLDAVIVEDDPARLLEKMQAFPKEDYFKKGLV